MNINQATLVLQSEGKFALRGSVYFDTAARLLQEGKKLINQVDQLIKVTVDLQDLQRSDTSVLALCTGWVRAAREQKKDIAFINPPAFILTIMKVYGLEALLPGLQK